MEFLIKFILNSKLSSYIYAKKAGPNLYRKHCICIKNMISKKWSKSFALRITSHPSSSQKYTPAACFSNIFHAFISFTFHSLQIKSNSSFGITPQQQNSVTIQSVNKLPKFDQFQDPNYALKITFWSLHPSSTTYHITPQQHLTKNTPQ
jgi:hypothetical protein